MTFCVIYVSHATAAYSEAGARPAESSHAQRVLSFLNQQRAVGKFCDAALNVGDGVVYLAHRNILACFSELFQQTSMPAEPRTEFCLRECPNDGLELLLNFVYTGELKLDFDNLDNVQHAAASLCVPEATALCEEFKRSTEDPGPLKRKRGRPRKAASDSSAQCLVKEENLMKEESNADNVSLSIEATSSTTTTTTRSGRVVKGPRRLVTDESPTSDSVASEKNSNKLEDLNISVEKENQDVVDPNPKEPSGETEVKRQSY